MRLSPLLLVVLLTACAGQATRPSATRESEVRASRDLADIAPALAESGSRRTLLVLDIDDTLLTSDGFFGSDKWYEWQKTLPAGDPGKVPCLFDVISLNYETGGQRPTQPDGPALVNALDYLVHEWAYKPVGYVSYGGVSGGLRSVQMSKMLVTSLKMMPIPESVALPFFNKLFDDTGLFVPGETQDQAARLMLEELLKWATALAPLRR